MALPIFNQLAEKLNINGQDYEDEYEDDYEDDYEDARPAKKVKAPAKISSFISRKPIESEYQAGSVVVKVTPEKFNDVQKVTDMLRDGYTVILNTEACDEDLARRICDFCSGSVYALDAHFEPISGSAVEGSPCGLFTCTPEEVPVYSETDYENDIEEEAPRKKSRR